MDDNNFNVGSVYIIVSIIYLTPRSQNLDNLILAFSWILFSSYIYLPLTLHNKIAD